MPGHSAKIRVHALVDSLRAGGAEFLLAEFAAVAPEAGIELSVSSLNSITPPAPAADRLRSRGIEPRGLGVTSMVRPRDLWRVRADLVRSQPNLVHTHLGVADFLGGIAARSLRIPSVATIHADWYPDGPADRARTWLASRARRGLAAIVLAVSDSARQAYIAAGRDTGSHVEVLRNGIVDRARPGSGSAVRRELGLDDDELVLTSLSALRSEKGFECAIDALRLLRPRFPRARLVIAGEGPHEAAVRAHAAGMGHAVLVVGHREDSMELLDATDVVVHPSRVDAFPTTLLEAMSAGVPVVATRVGGIPEIVDDASTGLLVESPASPRSLAATLDGLLGDADLRRRLGAAGRARFERYFRAEPWVQRLRAVYDRVLADA